MKSSLVVATLLCFITWMTSVHAAFGPVKNCCVVWSKTRIPLQQIVNYAIQTDDTCRIKAVQLWTKRGNRICANPNADFTKQAIKWVDKKKEKLQEKRQNEEGSASDITPAASSPATSTPATSTPTASSPTASSPTTSSPTTSSPTTSSPTTSSPTTSSPTASSSTPSKPTASAQKGSTKSKSIPLTKDRKGKGQRKKARRGNKKQKKCV